MILKSRVRADVRSVPRTKREREFFIENVLVRIHYIEGGRVRADVRFIPLTKRETSLLTTYWSESTSSS